jgi:hypothetical protein
LAYPPTQFENLREVVSEDYEGLSDPELAQIVTETLGISAIAAEDWLSSIGHTVQQYGPAFAQGAAGGAATGMVGGPWGALAGGLIGGVSNVLSSGAGGAQPRPAAAQPAPGPTGQAPAPSGAAAAPATGATGTAPAAASLLQLMNNPTVQQALFSMLLGRNGRDTVPAGATGTRVPVAAVAELVREAADAALTQYQGAVGSRFADSLPEYLAEARDRGADTGNALVRGIVLARLLEPPVVPVAPAIPVAPVAPVAYAPAAPGMPAAPAVPVAPVIATPGAFEPAPLYSTPDLGIGQPITLPTQAADAMAAALRQEAFEASLEEIFDLDGYAS